MTQEEKHLLLKDLCARLPYGVKVGHFGVTKELLWVIPSSENVMVGYDINDYEDTVIEDIKPYLRPMSTMTGEERKYYIHLLNLTKSDRIVISKDGLGTSGAEDIIDYLNAHYLDFRGLIPMGLALEAPKDMYKTE